MRFERIYTRDNGNKSYSSPASAKNDQLQVKEKEVIYICNQTFFNNYY